MSVCFLEYIYMSALRVIHEHLLFGLGDMSMSLEVAAPVGTAGRRQHWR
jgi:hypothetical protein